MRSRSTPTDTENPGIPRAKLLVPSIGSRIQAYRASRVDAPIGPSSPTSPSVGNSRAISRPSASWMATSASVTSVPSLLMAICARWNRSRARRPPRSARSATSRARDSLPTRSSALISADAPPRLPRLRSEPALDERTVDDQWWCDRVDDLGIVIPAANTDSIAEPRLGLEGKALLNIEDGALRGERANRCGGQAVRIARIDARQMPLRHDVMLDQPGDAGGHPRAQQLGALVAVVLVGSVGCPRHQMTDVMEERRHYDLVVSPLTPRQRRALQRVLELCHGLVVTFGAACREEGDDVHAHPTSPRSRRFATASLNSAAGPSKASSPSARTMTRSAQTCASDAEPTEATAMMRSR